MISLQPFFDQLQQLHDHICPRQVLGVRMGCYAAEQFGLALPQTNKRLLAFVETDGCFADGVAVATGCWLGHRTMRLVDFGKVAVTVVDTITERALRFYAHPESRIRALDYAPTGLDRWHAQVIGYQKMPASDLLCMDEVSLKASVTEIVSRPGRRTICEVCGEEILNEREMIHTGRILCRACGGGAYYAPLLDKVTAIV